MAMGCYSIVLATTNLFTTSGIQDRSDLRLLYGKIGSKLSLPVEFQRATSDIHHIII